MVADSRKAFIGTDLLVTREKKGENGIALSRANAQVARDAAQRTETVQNMPMPKTSTLCGQDTTWGEGSYILMNHYDYPH
jgi:hypothetical protein